MEDATDPIAVAKLFFESFKAVDGKFNFQLESTLDILLEILPGHHNSILIQLIKENLGYFKSLGKKFVVFSKKGNRGKCQLVQSLFKSNRKSVCTEGFL